MSFPTITVYGDSDNEQQIRLYSGEDPTDLHYATRFLIELNTKEEIDSTTSPKVFVKHKTRGVLGLRLGLLWWPTNIYYGKLIVYDDFHSNGLYWGTMRLRTMENTLPV